MSKPHALIYLAKNVSQVIRSLHPLRGTFRHGRLRQEVETVSVSAVLMHGLAADEHPGYMELNV